MVHIIPKGWHKSLPFTVGLHYGKTQETKEVTFDSSCLYKPLDWENDYNKLFGWSYGFHHRNSVRVGWRSSENSIELILYIYENGKLVPMEEPGILVPTGVAIKMTLLKRPLGYGLDIPGYGYITYRTHREIKPTWGYNLGLYFGGQGKAPHTMKITT